jgi:uncharacterized protein (TIGR02679 family)
MGVERAHTRTGRLVDLTRLERLLGVPELAWLLRRVRRRMEFGQDLTGVVTLTGASPAQKQAVERLLGRAPKPGKALTVSLSAVDALLRCSGISPDGLAPAVVHLTGPVTIRSESVEQSERAWLAAFAPLKSVVDSRAELVDWYESLRASGVVRRIATTPETAAQLLELLANVVSRLPAHGEPLGRFAARLIGDAHALDDSRPLATLTMGAARALAGLPAGNGAEWRREVWAAVGLLRDELSTTVLALGLPGDAVSAAGRALGAWREAGQPVALTLRQLVRDPPRFDLADVCVSVCENPVVLASAADQLGPHCPPLVCVSGQPSAAVMHLLRLLTAAGARLRYHGDFDWGGLRIATVLYDRLPFTAWRYDSHAYLAAAEVVVTRPLVGDPVDVCWDPELAATLRATGRGIDEELVLDDLLSDLAA